MNIAITELHPSIKVHSLEDGAEPIRTYASTSASTNFFTEIVGVRLSIIIGRVLDVKHGFTRIDEFVKGFAFGILMVGGTLLIDGEVDHMHDVVNNIGGVLETDGHVVFVGLVM